MQILILPTIGNALAGLMGAARNAVGAAGPSPAPEAAPTPQATPAATPGPALAVPAVDPGWLAAVLAIARPQIMRDEGCRLTAYPDPLSGAEPWTVGYGATGLGIGPDTCWTQDQADADLEARLATLCKRLDAALPWWRKLDPPRAAVLLNMSYNMGLGGLLEFQHTLDAVQDGNYPAASAGMLSSAWARQVGARASRLAMQMRTGQPQ